MDGREHLADAAVACGVKPHEPIFSPSSSPAVLD